MPITSLSNVVAGFQYPRFFGKAMSGTLTVGRPHSYWAVAGVPGVGTYDTTLNGVVLSSSSAPVNGQLHCSDPVSGNQHLSTLIANANVSGVLLVLDRLWHNGGFTITSTSPQTLTSPTWPARDATGTTNGEGVLCAVEVSAATGAGTPTLTVEYTNQAGTAGRTATNWVAATGATSIAGTMYPIGLQSGDTGIRSIQSLTLSATWTSGTINLVAYRVLGVLNISTAAGGGIINAASGGLGQMFNGTVPYFAYTAIAGNQTGIWGTAIYTRG